MTTTKAPVWQRCLVAVACSYEIVALFSDLPTITNVAHRYPVVAGALVGSLSVHFHPSLTVSS